MGAPQSRLTRFQAEPLKAFFRQLAWVLSQITIGDEARLPGAVPPAELRDYLRGLIDRLARLAHP